MEAVAAPTLNAQMGPQSRTCCSCSTYPNRVFVVPFSSNQLLSRCIACPTECGVARRIAAARDASGAPGGPRPGSAVADTTRSSAGTSASPHDATVPIATATSEPCGTHFRAEAAATSCHPFKLAPRSSDHLQLQQQQAVMMQMMQQMGVAPQGIAQLFQQMQLQQQAQPHLHQQHAGSQVPLGPAPTPAPSPEEMCVTCSTV